MGYNLCPKCFDAVRRVSLKRTIPTPVSCENCGWEGEGWETTLLLGPLETERIKEIVRNRQPLPEPPLE